MALQFLIDLLTGNLVLVDIPAAVAVVTEFLLLETGDFLLQENGDRIILN